MQDNKSDAIATCRFCKSTNTETKLTKTSNGHFQLWGHCINCGKVFGPLQQEKNKDKRKPVSLELRKERSNRHGSVRCMLCLFELPIGKLHGHHLNPYQDGGEDTLENILMVCDLCHTNIHNRQAMRKNHEL